MKNSPVTWNLPSNEKPVDPMGPPHWSSKFGDVNIEDVAIQISTTKNFEDTKAHWSYRLKIKRALGNLFGVGSGGCTDFHSGIGNVSYVKDILTETVVTTKFNCSQFGPHTDLGWGRMNFCLRNKCSKGYDAFIEGFPFKLDSHGSFSYSASSEFSGITHGATAFVDCDAGKCCACFGPKGGRGHYCSRECKAVNGGIILNGQVYVWYWIRTRMPERLWKRCMEFKMKTETGKVETYYIDRKTGPAHKGTCSQQFQTFLNEGTLLVKNKESFNNLLPVPGQISYREDNKKLYVNKGNEWDAIGSEKELEKIEGRLNEITKKSCKDILAANKFAISGIYSIQPAASKLFQVYCDMETHGGGWTFVYSYTFTNYNSFGSGSNAVTPRPNWPARTANVPISTTPPLSESSLGAVDWNLWKNIGKEFMVKSNINHWIVCQPNGGSLVTKKNGLMRCQNIKNVATACSGVVPYRVFWHNVGPTLHASSYYYYFNGFTRYHYPTHDPCGKNSGSNHKNGVSNPGGQIYLR
ncbi:Hypothetical predicted protein [Paramuricea clavata]|uniref:Uncharacterized protein n=1 Tax=Paramuricea clavata TaxID=317549 RepID=A0A7D9I3S3_PARCT|nr:Hypothetical predicted protein [Paramuricea clavata]